MSADVLRRAAALMRERAEAATDEADWRRATAKFGTRTPKGQHIASWHPAVALAVADAIDAAYTWFDPDDSSEAEAAMHESLLMLAESYLGEDA